MPDAAYVARLNQSYFSGGLSPAVMNRLAALPVDRADVRAFVERFFRTMVRGGFGPTEVSILHGEILGTLVSQLLPDTWEGRVPPITVAGRHRVIDDLLQRLMEGEGCHAGSLLDVACGFPPVTTVDTANALPGWQITGLDRALPSYLVQDGLGNYAVFDDQARVTYFQPLMPSAEAWTALLQDWQTSRERFESLLRTLLEKRAGMQPSPDRVEHDGATLEASPVRAFERPNLRFVRSDLDAAHVEPSDVVRCFNMLLYFDDTFRTEALAQFSALLREGGLLVCGTDWAFTTECRYFTYRKRDGRLHPVEFAFSLDNLSPLGIVPWYSLNDDDRELNLLADLTGRLRSEPAFLDPFTGVVDGMRADYGLCPRGADGYYGGIASDVPVAEIWTRSAAIADRLGGHELGQLAVEVLAGSGWRARVNEVGHIAVAVSD